MEEPTTNQENKYDASKESPKLGIKIEVYLDDVVLAVRTAESFEIAEQNLGSLEKWYESEQEKFEAEAERNQEEVEELESKDKT